MPLSHVNGKGVSAKVDEALKERGIQVDKSFAVMDYDDEEIARHLSPALSTVFLPRREFGQWCVEQLLSSDARAVVTERME
jgi:LacI family transcriptional regulator